MDAEILNIVTEAGGIGVAIFALIIFYKMISSHREERQQEHALWREEFKEANNKTSKVIGELKDVIRDNKK